MIFSGPYDTIWGKHLGADWGKRATPVTTSVFKRTGGGRAVKGKEADKFGLLKEREKK